MNFERFFLLPILMILLTASCSNDGAFNQISENQPLSVTSKTVLDYSDTTVTVKVEGQLQVDLTDIDRLRLYSNESCTGSYLGQALVSDFKVSGIDIFIPINTEVSLYVSTEASSDCVLVETYQHEALAPRAPVLSQTIPASPTRVTTTPGFFGLAFPEAGTIDFYDDVLCANLISQGSAVDFNTIGLPVVVTENAITTVHAVARDLNGGASACTPLLDFDHSNQLSGPPQLGSISHTSPNKDTFTPTLIGSTAVGTTDIGLYSDPGCLSALIEGDPAVFAGAGFQITALENDTIQIYAQSIDDMSQPSVCALLTSYTHDDEEPLAPAFVNISPISPTNQTTQPLVTGTSSVDTETISFYDSNTCLDTIGSGTRTAFESTGASVGVASNDTTEIYAKAFDAAGNDSSCVLFTSFTHNTTPPDAPIFTATSPASPTNGTLSPLVTGTASARTISLSMYSDDTCSTLVGQGLTADYESTGITVNLAGNTTNGVYVTARDFEGNVSNCFFHFVYDHSTAVAPSPGFFAAFPASPTRSSTTPIIIGTADNSIDNVFLYNDNMCTNELGNGTRGRYTSSGIAITISPNSTNDIYAKAVDEFGNDSLCTFVTQYIHTNIAPFDPTYLAFAPLSPNNNSTDPIVTGTSLNNPASQLPTSEVSFFDSPSCVSKLGEDTPALYAGAGIQLTVPQNAETLVYGRAFDDAGNFSNCVYLDSYIHNNLAPGAPIFLSVTPGSPSYSDEIRLQGAFSASPDFMNRVSMEIHANDTCTGLVSTVNPSLYETVGVDIIAPDNAITSFYGFSVNEVGTPSTCTSLTTFRHYDTAPQSLSSFGNLDGSISLSWSPDTISSPSPTYSVERSLIPGGPFSVIASGLISNTYRDLLISDNTQYYYRVFASNSTGRSKYSVEVDHIVSAPASVAVNSLNAFEADSRISLTWGGFPQNMVYKLSRSTNFGGPFLDLGLTLTGTSYTDSGLTNNQPYYYIVTASNPSGDSVQSNVAFAVPKVVSDAPTEFVLRPIQSHDVCSGAVGLKMSWTAPSYSTNFQVVEDTFKGSTNTVITTSNLTADRCNLANGAMYYYKIGAGWSGDRSPYTNSIGFYVRSAPTFTVYPGDGEVVLSWNAVTLHSDISGQTRRYDIYYSDDYEGEYSLLASNFTGTTFTDPLANGSGRYYYLQTYVTDLDGDTVYVGYPTSIRGVSPDVNPVAPTNLNLTVVNKLLRLDWTPPTHYNRFNLYHSTSFGGPYIIQSNPIIPFVPSASVVTGMNYFKVTADWGSFETVDSNIVSFREATITGLGMATSATDLTLSWNSIGGVQDYEVYRATAQNGVYASVATPLTNSYADVTAVTGQGYYYKVKARFADATEGQESDPIAGMRTDSSIPSGVSLTVRSSSLVRVDWPSVSGALNYRIQTSTTFGGVYVQRGLTGSTTFNLSGLISGTEVFVKVVASVGGSLFESIPVSVWVYAIPSSPSIVEGDNELDVSWSALAGAIDYDLLRSTDGITFTPVISSFASTSYLDTTAVNGTMYFYKIQTNFANGSTLSDQSLGYTPGALVLTPTGLRAENNNTGTEVELSWTAVPSRSNYNVYLSTTPGVYGAPVRSSTANSDVRVTGLTAGTTYYLTVTALKGTIETVKSNEVVIFVGIETAAPEAVYSDAFTVNITWSAILSAVTYDLYRSQDGEFFEVIASGLGVTSYLDASVDPSKTYFYKYKSFSVTPAEMSFSAQSVGVNLSEEPQTPLGFELHATATNEVELDWPSVPSVSGYEILRSATTSGPYTVIASVLPILNSYTDSTVSMGVKYFYVMRSLSQSGVPSPNSIEKSIELNAGPAGLAAINGTASIDLSWTALASATSYNIYRSFVSGGPYGFIANTASTSYSDLDIIADKTFYYVVEGVYADGSLSVRSAEESILRSGYLSLQVAIELTDSSLSSSDAMILEFDRTTTSFDTNDYDGVSSYELEIIGSNLDAASRGVNLIDEAGLVVGTVSIPGSTLEMTRIKAVVTPNVGADFYRLSLDATVANGDLIVGGAKLLVNQVNATKTKLYFPLASSDASPSPDDVTAQIFSTSSETYADFENALQFKRVASELSRIIDYNAWELEVVVSTTNSAEAILGLENLNTGLIVETTETRFSSNSIQLARIPFDEGSAEFGMINENNDYALRVKCEYECVTGEARLYKAGLWVKLENLAKARVQHRITNYNSFINSTTDLTDFRAYIDPATFTAPEFYYQILTADDVSSQANVDLITSLNDSGAVGISPVVGSTMFVDFDGISLQMSPQITLPAAGNYMTRVDPTGGDVTLRDASLIIKVGN